VSSRASAREGEGAELTTQPNQWEGAVAYNLDEIRSNYLNEITERRIMINATRHKVKLSNSLWNPCGARIINPQKSPLSHRRIA
jgi:hypothetical protein